jgi:ribose 1,5-bisphosphokinase PhnN
LRWFAGRLVKYSDRPDRLGVLDDDVCCVSSAVFSLLASTEFFWYSSDGSRYGFPLATLRATAVACGHAALIAAPTAIPALRASCPQLVTVFLHASRATILARLDAAGRSDAEIARRLKTYDEIVSAYAPAIYDVTVVNEGTREELWDRLQAGLARYGIALGCAARKAR